MLKNIIFVSSVVLSSQVVSEIFINTNTSERPKNAPVITMVEHGDDWYMQALYGISKPYPRTLGFLYSQGDWYTPFNKAGMPAPYDIRGWHK